MNWTGKFLPLLGRHEILEIDGDSMSPTLKNGDLVLIKLSAEVEAGDIVLAHHPFDKGAKLIKRIWRIQPDGKYFLIGDNLPQSTDSRHFGALPATDILGKAEAKLYKFM